MEAFTEGLKVLLEKRVIPTIIGIVVGILAFSFTSETNELVNRIGREWYILLFAGIAFLASTFLQYLFISFPRWISAFKEARIEKKREKADEISKIHDLWDFIDSLSGDDFQFIIQFLKNGNNPVEEYDAPYYYGVNIRDNSKIIKRKRFNDNGGVPRVLYKLDETFYSSLMYSKERYGKISNFEDVQNSTSDS